MYPQNSVTKNILCEAKVLRYVIGSISKLTGTIYIISPFKKYDSYDDALDEIKRCASTRSEDYMYIVMEIKASAEIANKPVKITEYQVRS
jgi:hypothetical protein